MKSAIVCLLVMAFAIGGMAPVQAGDRTFVTHDCVSVRVQPTGIMFACADGGFFVKRLDWRKWRTFRAVGHGVFHENDCDPSCADGTFRTRKGRIVLVRRQWCDNVGKYVFRRARITYVRPLLGKERQSVRLSCPY